MESTPHLEAILIAAKAAVLPFALALAGMIGAGLRPRRGKPSNDSVAPGAVALSVLSAVLIGYAAVNHEQWQFPPLQVMDWLPLIAAGSALLLAAAGRSGRGRRVWLGAQVVLAASAAWLMFPPALRSADAGVLSAWWLGATAAWVAIWRFLERHCAPQEAAVGLTVCAGALGLSVAFGGSILIGCVAGSIMGAMAAWIALGAVAGWPPLPPALLGSLVLLFGSVLLASYFYAEIEPLVLCGVLLGLFTIRLAPAFLRSRDDRRWRELAVDAASAAVPLLAPVGFTLWSFMRQSAQ